jgi:hydrogenase-4 component F
MTSLPILIAVFPLAGAVAGGCGLHARRSGYAAVGGAAASLLASIWMLIDVVAGRPVTAFNGFVFVDSLGAFFVFTIAIVVLAASFGSAAYVHAEEQSGDLNTLQVRLYFVCFGLFASLMLGSLQTGNLGLLFVLIEGSTLASVVLVGLDASSRALEAAWKYVIISSLGVTIALVGTLYLFYAGSRLDLAANLRLTWPFLYAHAAELSHPSLRLAFLLAVVGYGTKVGLAPMHTWLPDAHAEAPSPASALLSAALLNTGMYAIIRFLAIARVGLGVTYVRDVLLTFGFLSVAIGALFLIKSANLKRMFAYSSVEHMGIIAVGLGFGGTIGLYGALLHTLNHAIGKSVLFLSSGDVVLAYRSRESAEIRGVLSALPFSGGVMLLGSLAILGSPPFGPFLSELTIVRAGFLNASPVLAALLLLLFAVAFIGLAHSVSTMVLGPARERLHPYRSRWERMFAATPLIAGMAALLLLGVWIPSGLHHALMSSIAAMTR